MKRQIIRDLCKPDRKELNLEETIFHNANGYLGVRGCLEEGLPQGVKTMRGMYINGFYEIIPMKQAENLCNFVEEKESMINIADTQTIELSVCGERFSLFEGEVLQNRRILDMECGTTLRDILWRSPAGHEVSIRIRRMASFRELSLFTIEYTVTPLNFDGELRFTSRHNAVVANYCDPDDPRLAAEGEKYLHVEKLEVSGHRTVALTRTRKSRLSVCSITEHTFGGAAPQTEEFRQSDTAVVYTASVSGHRDQPVYLQKYAVFTDSVRCQDPAETALAIMDKVLENGLPYYLAEQKAYLDQFWQSSEMTVQGDDATNAAISFNMYSLLQSVAKDSHCSIAAKGLSGEGYEGHYFWDTEMFMLPFFTLTNPVFARMLLSYRYDTLGLARHNAALLGHKKGALYPWRTITGVECSGYFPSGTAQYHIDGDIAYAVVQYYLATGDLGFMAEKGAEMLVETARLWIDTGTYYEGRFEIQDVTGPDEYTCMVNNNFYTNATAKYNLEWALRICRVLQEKGKDDVLKRLCVTDEELTGFRQAADAMFLPYDEKLGIHPQDDSFLHKPVWDFAGTPKENYPLLLHYHPLHLYRFQVCKQADTVMAYALFPHIAAKDIMLRSFAYYEGITTHDSSLSTCAFSLAASRLGLQEKACQYFGNSAVLDLENTHGNTQDGFHTANMGGSYMAIVLGFAGLFLDAEGVSLSPFLPKGWEGFRFKFHYHGALLQVTVTETQAEAELLDGPDSAIGIYGKQYLLTQQKKRCSVCLQQ